MCPDGPLEPGNTGIVLLTADIEATCMEMKSKGVEFTRDLAKSEWNESLRYAMFMDLDGNVFWLTPK